MNQALLIAQLALCCVVLLMLGWLLLHQRRTKKLQDDLLAEWLPRMAPQQRWFRINLASPDFFARRMRVLGFEAKGLLIDQGEQLRVVAVRSDGERLERWVPKSPGTVRWRGNVGLRSANLHWIELGQAPDFVMVSADTGMNAMASREATADILRALLSQQPLDASALTEFALEKHPVARIAVVAFLVLLLTTLGDYAFSEHQVLRSERLIVLSLVAGFAGLLIYPVFKQHKVPGRETLVLTMLLVGMLGAAMPRAALRLDQWLSGGAVATSYRLVHGGLLQPVEEGPPPVRLRDIRAYWDQFEPGSIHELDIVHGPLGIWQLDRSRLNALTREWYRREDDATPAASHPASTEPTPPR
ncbi:hypothetical protein [Pelomonas sp. Root1237]|uniref:hypothetical protein n=1 Tax=Pelomonas sp. Root1237 TaxID=1736434 RepID=UPI0006F20BFE|nr:hypothetical protein [Pelomonas sp. Root1237]KQV89373.1 hypothetical protein ASC91_12265 [Pelomonas sp. Root1237]